MDLLQLGILLIVALGVSLFIVILLTRGVFARDLTQALKRVTQQEQTLQENAAMVEQRLSQMEREYEAKVKRGHDEAEQLIQEAKNQAMNIRTAAIEEAKHRARQLMLEAEQSHAQVKRDVAKELNGQAAQQACETLRLLLPSEALGLLHRALVAELLAALRAMDVTPLRQSLERVVVVTGQPLSDAAATQLTQWVATVGDGAVPLEVKTDPSLVAGCVVHVGLTVVDGSLPSRLARS